MLKVGNTPTIFIEKYEIYLKLEDRNPTGSVKDRPALFMIKGALMRGLLKEGGTLVEPTSGNTGIALAMFGAFFSLKVFIVAPESISKRKINLIKSYGAEVVTTPTELGMKGAVERAMELVEETGGYMPNQFENPLNPLSHELTTGPEIIRDMDFEIDAFVAGIGTGGTLTGVGKALRKFFGNKVRIFGVEPSESNVISGGKPGKHGIEGIGAGFIPKTLELGIMDEVIQVSSEEAEDMKNRLAKMGFSFGFSTGANVAAALKVKEKYRFKRVITIAPDGGIRYV